MDHRLSHRTVGRVGRGAELTQHIPNKGEHLIRYYGCYSNKARGLSAKQGAASPDPVAQPDGQRPEHGVVRPPIIASARLDRRRWAMLIKRIYEADPLLCPQCGGTMQIIAFIEARHGDVLRKILQHCGLISAGFAGLAGMIHTSRLYAAEPGSGAGFELDAIAAAVVGGVSFTGGVGTVFGTLLGAMIIGILSKGLNQAGIHFSYQEIIKGLVILAAVYVDVRARR